MPNPLSRETMKLSEVIRAMEHALQTYGDRPVYFTDGYFRYGVTFHMESAPNYDAPQAMLVSCFSLTTGMNGPKSPINLEHE